LFKYVKKVKERRKTFFELVTIPELACGASSFSEPRACGLCAPLINGMLAHPWWISTFRHFVRGAAPNPGHSDSLSLCPTFFRTAAKLTGLGPKNADAKKPALGGLVVE
jgi:hypothetical protein